MSSLVLDFDLVADFYDLLAGEVEEAHGGLREFIQQDEDRLLQRVEGGVFAWDIAVRA